MRRADRLFELVQLVRGRRLSTAAWIAARLEVSERTVYRDIADLQAQGVPIEGEAGVGYRMRAGFDLPPLMFTRLEAQALVASIRIAGQWLDPALSDHGRRALSKILAVLPPAARAAADSLPLFAPLSAEPAGGRDDPLRQRLQQLREACEARQVLSITYRDAGDGVSARDIRPLGTAYWGAVWTVIAWCELRDDFRSFRVDRIASVTVQPRRFRDEPGRTLPDFFRRMGVSG